MMKLPRLNSDSDANQSLIMYLTDPTRLEQFETLMPGCTERLLKEVQKQLSHNRKRFWAWIVVFLIVSLSATNKVPTEILHKLMAGF